MKAVKNSGAELPAAIKVAPATSDWRLSSVNNPKFTRITTKKCSYKTNVAFIIFVI